MPINDAANDAGLRAAAEVAEEAIKFTSGKLPSKKIPPTVRSYIRAGIAYVSAGGYGGRAAPNAYMFETPGARHPLFAHGPRGTDGWKHWYAQPYRPFMEEAVTASLDEMAEAYGNAVADALEAEFGYR